MIELAGLKTSTESVSPPLLGKIQMGFGCVLGSFYLVCELG